MRRLRGQYGRQRRARVVGVVREHAAGSRDHERCVLVGRVAVGASGRRIVDTDNGAQIGRIALDPAGIRRDREIGVRHPVGE